MPSLGKTSEISILYLFDALAGKDIGSISSMLKSLPMGCSLLGAEYKKMSVS